MADEKIEKLISEGEVLPEGEIEENEDSDLDDEETSLSPKNIILLSILGIIGLLIFVILLFPVEELLRFIITKNTQNSNYTIDFKKLHFPFFGVKTIDSFVILTRDNLEFKSEEIQFTVDIPELYRGNIITHMDFYSAGLETEDLTLNARTMSIDANLIQSERENPSLNGSIQMSLGSGKILRIPSFPVLGDLSNTSIRSLSLITKKNGNRFTFEKGVFDLSIAKITLKGRMDLAPFLKNSRLDMEICPKLSREFSTERQDLADMLSLMAKDGKEPCIPLSGTLADPKLNISLPGNENSPNSIPEAPKFPP